MSQVHLIDHPLVQHKLTLMRKKDASTNTFRRLLNELASLMAYEVTRDMPLQDVQIETPLETMTGKMIDGKKLVFVSILRAGNGILEGMLNVVPGARVGHVGLYRDPKTLVAVEYYFKMPQDMQERDIVVVDPMLATGNSAVAAVDRLKETRPKSIRFVSLLAAPEGLKNFHAHHPDVPVYTAAVDRLKETKPRSIRFVSLVSAPEGIAQMQKHHPDVPIFTAAIDRELNDHGYIVPGLGDAGDRIYGTK